MKGITKVRLLFGAGFLALIGMYAVLGAIIGVGAVAALK